MSQSADYWFRHAACLVAQAYLCGRLGPVSYKNALAELMDLAVQSGA